MTVSDFTPAISVAITIAVAIVIDVRDERVMNFGPDILEVRRNTFAHWNKTVIWVRSQQQKDAQEAYANSLLLDCELSVLFLFLRSLVFFKIVK